MSRKLVAVATAVLGITSAGLYGTPALADQIRDKQWHLEFLKVTEAHEISTGKGVTVALIDSGVATHPDLAGNVLSGTDFENPGGDGHRDTLGHGTAMAGLIAAHGRDGNGALGIAPDAQILPIRHTAVQTFKRDLGPSIEWAISHGASVINISAAGGVSSATTEALAAAAKADVVVIAGAGNRPTSSGVAAPAFLESVVAVGAINREGNQASISVTGPALDIMAPGADVETTGLNGGYRTGTGTSNSAAIVAGAAALVRSKFPDLTAPQVVERLESTATDKGEPGVDNVYGHGVLNLVAALSEGVPPVGSGSTTSPSASAAAPTADAGNGGGDNAAPDADSASSNTPLIVGGAVVVVLLGALIAFLAVRRKNRPST